MIAEVVKILMRHGVGAVQMDCPEFSLYGNPRPPRSKDSYDIPEFKQRCREIATSTCDIMECLMEKGSNPEILISAIIGLENSPSCGVERTNRTIHGRNISCPGRGHLMEASEVEMHQRGLDIPMIGVSLKEGERENRLRRLEALVTKEI